MGIKKIKQSVARYLPESFDEYLNGNAYIISLKRHEWRGKLCIDHLKNAGFQNIQIFDAIDGFKDDITKYEKELGLVFHPDVYPGAKGASASMLTLYKKVVDEKLPFLTIFEDDALPHPNFKVIGNNWYSKTKKNVDFLFLGSQFNSTQCPGVYVVEAPAFCLHAYTITYNGAVKALKLCKLSSTTIRPHRTQFPGVDILDCEVNYWMHKNLINWQNWNIEGILEYPFPVIGHRIENDQVDKDSIRGGRCQGLIWQNLRSGSCIHGEEIVYLNS